MSSSAVSLAGNDEAADTNDRLCILRSIELPNDDGASDRLNRRGSVLLTGAERSMVCAFGFSLSIRIMYGPSGNVCCLMGGLGREASW